MVLWMVSTQGVNIQYSSNLVMRVCSIVIVDRLKSIVEGFISFSFSLLAIIK
jgi:hypothetical protein